MKPIGPKPKDLYRDIALPEKVLKRCRKPPPWVHFKRGEFTACGKKDAYRLFCGPGMAPNLDVVTCPRCLAGLKEKGE